MKMGLKNLALIQLRKSFSFLFEQFGFRIIKEEVSESFGNSLIILATKDVKIWFTTDRGDLRITIDGSNGIDDGFNLSVVRTFVTGCDLLLVCNVDDAANFLRKNMSMIKEMFKPDKLPRTQNQLRELSKLEVAKNVERWNAGFN